jgi:hypothetical protein
MSKTRFLTVAFGAALCLGVGLGCGGDDQKQPVADSKGAQMHERPTPAAPGGGAPAPAPKRKTAGNAASQ